MTLHCARSNFTISSNLLSVIFVSVGFRWSYTSEIKMSYVFMVHGVCIANLDYTDIACDNPTQTVRGNNSSKTETSLSRERSLSQDLLVTMLCTGFQVSMGLSTDVRSLCTFACNTMLPCTGFMSPGAVTHGVTPWTSSHTRSYTILCNVSVLIL